MPSPTLGTTAAAKIKDAKLRAFNENRVLSWERIADIIDQCAANVGKPKSVATGAEEVYQAYPRKKGKLTALKAIERASKIMPMDQLLAITKAYAEECERTKQDMQYVPHPSTWFNQGHYLNEPDPVHNTSNTPDYNTANPLG